MVGGLDDEGDELIGVLNYFEELKRLMLTNQMYAGLQICREFGGKNRYAIGLTSSHPETPVFWGLGKFVESSIEATGVAFGVHSTKGA